jgi:hypothetical protein
MEENNTSSGVQDNQKGVSNTTIAVLLVLALVITIIGTWAVMNSMAPETPVRSNTNIAQVSLTIYRIDTGITQASGQVKMSLNEVG